MSDSASQQWRSAMQAIRQRVETLEPQLTTGRLVRATGLVLEAVGLRLPVGASCLIELGPGMAPAEAEVVGFAMTSDASDIVMPSKQGAARAITGALRDGGINAGA